MSTVTTDTIITSTHTDMYQTNDLIQNIKDT